MLTGVYVDENGGKITEALGGMCVLHAMINVTIFLTETLCSQIFSNIHNDNAENHHSI